MDGHSAPPSRRPSHSDRLAPTFLLPSSTRETEQTAKLPTACLPPLDQSLEVPFQAPISTSRRSGKRTFTPVGHAALYRASCQTDVKHNKQRRSLAERPPCRKHYTPTPTLKSARRSASSAVDSPASTGASSIRNAATLPTSCAH